MKLRLKSVIRHSNRDYDLFQNNQILFSVGNYLCIQQIDSCDFQFIQLDKRMDHLCCFKSGANKKLVLTIEKINENLEVCSYNLKSERRSVQISDGTNFFPNSQIVCFDLLPDFMETSLIYGFAKTKTDSAIFLVDVGKSKLISLGFYGYFEDLKVSQKESFDVSICGKGFLKLLKPFNGSWETEEKLPKKLSHQNIIAHQWLDTDLIICSSKTSIFIFQDHEILQTIKFAQNITIFQRIPYGFFVVSDNNKISLFTQDSQTFLLSLQKDKQMNTINKIIKAVLNQQKDNLVMLTDNYDLFSWKTEQLTEVGLDERFNIVKHQTEGNRCDDGFISLASNKNYALINEGNQVSLWDLQKNQATISMEIGSKDQKMIGSIGISPDGYSMMIGLPQKVKLFRVLLPTFKFYAQFPFKRCKSISYSHGGQLVACSSGKGSNCAVTILNTLFLKQVMVVKTHFEPLQIVWSEHDDEFLIVSKKKTILCFSIAQKAKIWQLQLDLNINLVRYDYTTSRILASTDKYIYSIQDDKNIEKIIIKIPNFNYIFPSDERYYITTKKGALIVSNDLSFHNLEEIKLFSNRPFHLAYKKDRLICYSQSSEIIMIQCSKNLYNIEKNSVLDTQLIMIEKEEVHKFFEKVRLLQCNLETLQHQITIKLQDQKHKYEQSLNQNKLKFAQQLKSIDRKYQNIQIEKLKQEKQCNKVFNQIEYFQLKNVNEIQMMYDKKLELQKQKYMILEQKNLEQKSKDDKLLKDLQMKHQKDIQKIRIEYQQNLQRQINKMQVKKNSDLQYKKKVQTKLINLEEESQLTLFSLQLKKDDEIKVLNENLMKLKGELGEAIVKSNKNQQDYKKIVKQYELNTYQLNNSQSRLKEYISRVNLLEEQIKKKNTMIEQRNIFIEQQAQLISGLEKTKYVLGFRTTQIRKQLQPKQCLIDKLKKQLFKIDEEYNQQRAKTFKLEQKLQKAQKICQVVKKQLSSVKSQLKGKSRKYGQFCSQIFKIVNHIDKNQWSFQIMQFYKKFIQDEKRFHGNGHIDDHLSEQITKNLMHVEKSLIQVNTRNEKALKVNAMDKARKMKENADLIFDLNNMRKKENQYLQQIKQKDIEIDRLKKQVVDSFKTQRNTTTANTRRNHHKERPVESIELELNMRRHSDHKNKRSRVFSANNTLLWKDPAKRQKTKIVSDLARELQIANNTIRRQDRMIQELNQRLLGLNQNFVD